MRIGIALLALAMIRLGAAELPARRPFLLPAPQRLAYQAGSLSLDAGATVLLDPNASPRVHEIAEILIEGLRANGIDGRIAARADSAPGSTIRLSLQTSANSHPEGYEIQVGDDAVLKAPEATGLLWSVQTLLQAVQVTDGHQSLPHLQLTDWPLRPWRGLMIDPPGVHMQISYLQRLIREISAYKLNILHLGLTDDDSWCVEIKGYPGVTPPGLPFYTQAELKELVAYARRFGVEIIPCIGIPGHCDALLAAYPEFSSQVPNLPYQGIGNPGKSEYWDFLRSVIHQIAEIFPSPVLDTGMAEPFGIQQWLKNPDCQRYRAEHGVDDIYGMFNQFTNDVDALVRKEGRQMIVANDALHLDARPALNDDIIYYVWDSYASASALANAGRTIVNIGRHPLYLSSFGLRDGDSMEQVWRWDPAVFASSQDNHDVILYAPLSAKNLNLRGGEAVQFVSEPGLAERRLFPRTLIVAEALWRDGHPGPFSEYSERLETEYPKRLRQLGWTDFNSLPIISLFDGGNLDRWTAIDPSVKVEDTFIVPSAGPLASLSTKAAYADFDLTFEAFIAGPNEKAMVQIRCTDARQLADESGTIVPLQGGYLDRQTFWGKWVDFELTARGSIVTLTTAGGLAWKNENSQHRAGPITLWSNGASTRFRNINLRELSPDDR